MGGDRDRGSMNSLPSTPKPVYCRDARLPGSAPIFGSAWFSWEGRQADWNVIPVGAFPDESLGINLALGTRSGLRGNGKTMQIPGRQLLP